MVLGGLDGSLGWFGGCLSLVPPLLESYNSSSPMRLPRPFLNSQAYVGIICMDYISQLLPSLHLSSGPLYRPFSSHFHAPHPTAVILNVLPVLDLSISP